MQNALMNETKSVTIRLDAELVERINKLKEGSERNLSQQIRLMLKKYLEMKECE